MRPRFKTFKARDPVRSLPSPLTSSTSSVKWLIKMEKRLTSGSTRNSSRRRNPWTAHPPIDHTRMHIVLPAISRFSRKDRSVKTCMHKIFNILLFAKWRHDKNSRQPALPLHHLISKFGQFTMILHFSSILTLFREPR